MVTTNQTNKPFQTARGTLKMKSLFIEKFAGGYAIGRTVNGRNQYVSSIRRDGSAIWTLGYWNAKKMTKKTATKHFENLAK